MSISESNGGRLVSVVVVNYNGAGVLKACLQSLRAQRHRPLEVIVVDNGSTDGSVEVVRSEYPEVHVVANRENLGFAGGSNKGFEVARGEYVALLNNDAVVEEDWLDPLLALLQRPGVGIACSRVITEGVPSGWYEMNGTINYLGYNIMRVFTDLSMVFFASGASLLFRKNVADGLFLNEYFIYHEDVYFSWKVRLSGSTILMAQDSVVHHRGGTTSKQQTSATVTFFQERNRVLNCLLLYEARTLFLLLPYLLADAVAKVLLSLITKRKSFIGIVRAYIWLCGHGRWINEERARLKRQRRVPDSTIMKLMSSDVIDSDKNLARAVNRLSRLYADAVGLAHYG